MRDRVSDNNTHTKKKQKKKLTAFTLSHLNDIESTKSSLHFSAPDFIPLPFFFPTLEYSGALFFFVFRFLREEEEKEKKSDAKLQSCAFSLFNQC